MKTSSRIKSACKNDMYWLSKSRVSNKKQNKKASFPMSQKNSTYQSQKRSSADTAEWEKWLEKFLDWKINENKGIAERTLCDYRKHVRQFFTRHPEAIDPKKVDECVHKYFSEDIVPATRNLRRAYLKCFFDFLGKSKQEQGGSLSCPGRVFPKNPISGIKKQKDTGRLRRIEDWEVQALLNAPDTKNFTGCRDKMILQLQVDTAIRPGEVVKLKPSDIRLDQNPDPHKRHHRLIVPATVAKTRCARSLPFTERTAESIREFLKKREENKIPREVPLFCTRDARPLGYDAWNRRFKKYSQKAGVSLAPYDLRHYAAIVYYENSHMDCLKLQTFLGHGTLEMSSRYVRFAESDLAPFHEEFSPLNGRKTKAAKLRRSP